MLKQRLVAVIILIACLFVGCHSKKTVEVIMEGTD